MIDLRKQKIRKLSYNWFFTANGEEYSVHEVGAKGVVSIREQLPLSQGDKCCYLVEFENGMTERIFNPNKIVAWEGV